MQSKYFSELNVVEFASVLAGPAVGMFFAELGAHVLKIENATTGGDVTRRWKLPGEDPRQQGSAYFSSVNWGKRHLFLDFNDPEQLRQARDLALEADLVIANFKPSSAKRFGLDAESLRRDNPRLVYGQINAFADPEDDSPAFDVVLQAEAGFMYMCGHPDGPPAKMPVALIDILAAHQLKEGLLLALMEREKTGRGATVSCSLMESALASLANQASNFLMTGHIPQRMGALHPNIAPYGEAFRCADGQVILLAAGTETQFQTLCEVLELDDLKKDPRFAANADRVVHREALAEALAPGIARFQRDELLNMLLDRKVPAARIRNMQQVFERPEAQAMILDATDEQGQSSRRMRTIAFHISP